jgi:hypothetical protein
MLTRRSRLRRVALVLALIVLAAIVTGIAASATSTVVPNQLTGKYGLTGRWALLYGGTVMVVGPRGNVTIHRGRWWYHAKFLRVTEHGLAPQGRMSISGGPRSCSGTGTYAWAQWYGLTPGQFLHFTTIHDACKPRVDLLGSHPRTLPWKRLN